MYAFVSEQVGKHLNYIRIFSISIISLIIFLPQTRLISRRKKSKIKKKLSYE